MNNREKNNRGKLALKKGLIWGAVIAVIVAIIGLVICFNSYSTGALIGSILVAVGSFTFTACMFWDCWLADFFLFFCRSFSAPFGFVFNLDLDGIIWLLTVKLALWIICGVLSALFFLLGLFLSLALSLICFPFILWYFVKKPEELDC